MIEISEYTQGCKRLLDFRRFVRLGKLLPVKINVYWHVDTDDIIIEFPNGYKVSSTMFEGLSDPVVVSWLYTLYMIRK